MASPELAELQKITAQLVALNDRVAWTNQQLSTIVGYQTSIAAHVAQINTNAASIATYGDMIETSTDHIADNSDTVAQWTATNADALTIVQRLLASMLYVGGSGGVAPKPADVESFVNRFKWEGIDHG